jgi:hypothetical protein
MEHNRKSTQVYLEAQRRYMPRPPFAPPAPLPAGGLGPPAAGAVFAVGALFGGLAVSESGVCGSPCAACAGLSCHCQGILATSLAWFASFCMCVSILHPMRSHHPCALHAGSREQSLCISVSINAPERPPSAERLCARAAVESGPCACSRMRENERRHGTGLRDDQAGRRGCDTRQAAYPSFLHAVSRAVVSLTPC